MAGQATDGVLVATVKKNSREEVRVVRKEWEGHDLLDARVWTLSAVPGGDSTPTKKGLCLRPETWQELCAAVLSELDAGEVVHDDGDPFGGDV